MSVDPSPAAFSPDAASSPRHVFVYGTLRRGEQRDINRLSPPPRWVGQGSVAGALHDLGNYPGLALREHGHVTGEVYEITPELERVLDEIEEVWPQQTGEYSKREVRVQLSPDAGVATGQGVLCLLYEIAPAYTEGKPLIGHGDWVVWRLSKTR